MHVEPGAPVGCSFTTHNPTTKALANADALPVGTVLRNGIADAVVVTITNTGSGNYRAAFTVPEEYDPGDQVELYVAATVATIAGGGIVWRAVVDSLVAEVAVVTTALATMIVVDGEVFQYTTNALERAPSGSTAVTILPLQSTAGNTGRLSPIYLTAYQHCQIEATILVVDHEGNALDLTGKTLSLVAWDADAPTVAVFELRSDGASPELTIGGASSNQVTIDGSDTHTATARELQWRLYNVTDDRALASGKLTIVEGAVGPLPT